MSLLCTDPSVISFQVTHEFKIAVISPLFLSPKFIDIESNQEDLASINVLFILTLLHSLLNIHRVSKNSTADRSTTSSPKVLLHIAPSKALPFQSHISIRTDVQIFQKLHR